MPEKGKSAKGRKSHSNASASGLRICLFQALQVYVGTDPLTEFHYPRQQVRELLAFLLLHRKQPIPRARLAFLLWPDVPEPDAVANLRRALYGLKRTLPTSPDPLRDYVQADRQSVAWNLDSDYWLDVEEFENLLAEESAAALARAAALYNGDLLPEVYSDWVLPERERLISQYLDALDRLVGHQRARGQLAQAVVTARRLLARDPLRERTHQQLMALYYSNGDRASALRQYDQCRDTLRQQLEVEPLEETRTLQERILRGEPLDTSPVGAGAPVLAASDLTPTVLLRPHPFPAGIMPPLVGRESESAWLEQHWNAAEAKHGAIVLVQGEAGVGKTRLVSEFIQRTHGRALVLAGGAHASEQLLPYHPLVEALRTQQSILTERWAAAATDPASEWWLAEVALVLPELRERWTQLSAPAAQETGQARLRLFQGLTRALLELAGQLSLVVILDDLQWADEATLGWLEYAARQMRSARVLMVGIYRSEEESPALQATRLALVQECQAQELRLGRLSAQAVAVLIQEITGSAGRAMNFSRRLYRETEGNPLFLVETLRALYEAGSLRHDTRGWQADWDQAAADSAGLPLPATVHQVIRARISRLSETAQQVLETASVIGRQFDSRVACQASGRAEEEAVAALDEASRAQLLAEDENGYRFTHDKIQEVAYSDLSAARRRLLHRRVAESLESRPRNRSEIFSQLAYHYDRAEVWDQVVLHATAAAYHAKQMYASKEALENDALALKALTQLLDQATDEHARQAILMQRFDVLSSRHGIWTLLGQFEAAKADLDEMAALAREIRDDGRLGDALNGLGYHFMNMGQPAEARRPLEAALAIKKRQGHRPGEIDSLITLGTVYVLLGEATRGLSAFHESRILSESLDDEDALARSEWATGAALYEGLGEYERAIEHLQHALQLTRSRNRGLESGSLLMMGAAHVRLGDYAAGRACLEQALEIAQQIGDRPAAGWGLLYLSWADRETGQYDSSLERARQALAVGQDLQAAFLNWYAWHSLARLYMPLGRPQDALAAATQAHQISIGRTFHPSMLARTLATLARVHLDTGQAELARRLTDQALSELAALRINSAPELQTAYFDCYLALQTGDSPNAEDALRQAHKAMMAQAEAISEREGRNRFLREVAINHEIAVAWEARFGGRG